MSARRTLALDANLIVLLAVGLTDPAYIRKHKRLYPTFRAEHFEILLEIVKRAPALATTTHALTEASNLLRQCADPMRSEITAALGALIERSDELTPKARAVSRLPEFRRLGLTDAAFTRLDRELYAVLSADLDLVLVLQAKGFEVVNFHHVIFD